VGNAISKKGDCVSWLRYRFYSSAEDYRPIYEPPALPVGPWWCSGYSGDDKSVLIAYVKSEQDILNQWPEAEIESFVEVDKIKFTDRFPKPDWWQV
jgi:hypothetical protein